MNSVSKIYTLVEALENKIILSFMRKKIDLLEMNIHFVMHNICGFFYIRKIFNARNF